MIQNFHHRGDGMKSFSSKTLWVFLFLCVALISFIPAEMSFAYDRWSQNDDATYCGSCHGDFRSNIYLSPSDGMNWGNLHNLHRQTMVSGDCDVCHGSSTFPVMMASSSGGDGMAAIGCMGCHGREEDTGINNPEGSNGYGAGLRQHHYNSGETICANCHLDADPANYSPVGEDVLPTYYANPGLNHPNIPVGSCNDDGSEHFAGATVGQDNDGDGVYDGDDGDCTATAVPGSLLTSVSVTNFPNPFNPVTTIHWVLPSAADVDLAVFDVSGHLVRTLLHGERQQEGRHDVTWSGNDNAGGQVPAGVYFYSLTTDAVSNVGRMVLVK
jgi:hypothetical protein